MHTHRRNLICSVALASLLVGCGGGGGGGSGSSSSGSFSLKGTLSSSASSSLMAPSRPKARAVAVSDVKTVLGFSTGYNWWRADVAADGTFDIGVDPSTPVGLVFANSSDQLVGFLQLPNGLSALPLQVVSSQVKSIDLGALALSADAVTPSSMPNAFADIGSTDLAALLQAGGLFAATLENPDADGDGKIDLLQGAYYRPFVTYFVNAGNFGGATTPTISSDLSLNAWRLSFAATGAPSYPDTVTFLGPSGTDLWAGGVTNNQAPNKGNDFATYGSPAVENSSVPPAGEYTVDYASGTTLTFHVPDQSNATADVALAVPTVMLNSDQTIGSLSWTYQLGGLKGSGNAVTPASLITGLSLQINADNQADYQTYVCATSGVTSSQASGYRVFNANDVAPTTTRYTLDCQNIPWSVVSSIAMAYNDVYGNHVVVTYFK